MATALVSGLLTKQGGKRKNWKRRWFICTEERLDYWQVPRDFAGGWPDPITSERKGSIELSQVHTVRAAAKGEAGKRPGVFVVETPGRAYRVQAASAEESARWVAEVGGAASTARARLHAQQPASPPAWRAGDGAMDDLVGAVSPQSPESRRRSYFQTAATFDDAPYFTPEY